MGDEGRIEEVPFSYREKVVKEAMNYLKTVLEEEGVVVWAEAVGHMVMENHMLLGMAMMLPDDGVDKGREGASECMLRRLQPLVERILHLPVLHTAFIRGINKEIVTLISGQ
ncbi:MAG: hypothetical protein U9Q67_05130 [Patescibacteria group bacterium]|nr:hypothetical protein [Patescibacteria group bacterium]